MLPEGHLRRQGQWRKNGAVSQGQSSWMWATALTGSSGRGWRTVGGSTASWPPQTHAPSSQCQLIAGKRLPSQYWCHSYLPSRCDCTINIHEWNVVRSNECPFWVWVDKKQICLPLSLFPICQWLEKTLKKQGPQGRRSLSPWMTM